MSKSKTTKTRGKRKSLKAQNATFEAYTLPKRVKVFDLTYDVIEVEPVSLGKDCAEIDPNNGKILVNQELGPALKRNAFLHEVLHAINFALGFEDDEKQVNEMTTGLLNVIDNNPDFVEALSYED